MNFIFFSIVLWDWNDGAHFGTQISLELARRGHRVLFVQARASEVEPSLSPVRILALSDLGLDKGAIERAWHGLDAGRLDRVAERLSALVREWEQPDQPRVAIWIAPFEPFARLLPVVRAIGYRPIYYPIDDYESMITLGFYRFNPTAEDALGRDCEAIFALSSLVAKKMERFGKPVQIIPRGVNLDEFGTGGQPANALPDVLRGERTLGFWGWLGDTMVDAQTLAFIARSRPSWVINLLGDWEKLPDCPTIPDQLKNLPNVRFHGRVAHHRLKDYAPFFDVCLIPAPDNDFSRGRDPIKVYEYLALHKPVVCTHMPQLAGMPYVRNASSPQEFLHEIEGALVTPIDGQVLDAFLAKQTWEARAEELLDVVRDLGEREPASVPPDSPAASPATLVAPSTVQESPGLKVYLNALETNLNALETNLEQTRKWARELEAAVIAKDRELQRIYHFLPVRILRWLYHLFV
jgi:glycosyltransferase involved in cell wall biosynthesis